MNKAENELSYISKKIKHRDECVNKKVQYM